MLEERRNKTHQPDPKCMIESIAGWAAVTENTSPVELNFHMAAEILEDSLVQ